MAGAHRAEDAVGAANHRRNADSPQGGLHDARLAVGANEHGDVARRYRSRSRSLRTDGRDSY